MIQLIESLEDRAKVVSALAGLEVRSAIRRRQHQGDISIADAEIALTHVINELKRVVEVPLTSGVLEIAATLVDQHRLRALDSLQLASAIFAKSTMQTQTIRFVASDLLLLSAAQSEGLNVWNPCE